jgi:hypothetical protein
MAVLRIKQGEFRKSKGVSIEMLKLIVKFSAHLLFQSLLIHWGNCTTRTP